MSLEIERKYLQVPFAPLRRRLEGCGARCLGAHLEENLVFDRDGSLRGAGRLLRLRTQRWPHAVRCLLTLKLPAGGGAGYKKREERETLVEDGEAARALLEGLGYAVAARYEKVREPWRLGDVEVELDTLPFGEVVELEGPENGILAAEPRLGLDKAEISTKTYHELHQDWRFQNSLAPAVSFVFDDAHRAEWLERLGLAPAGGALV